MNMSATSSAALAPYQHEEIRELVAIAERQRAALREELDNAETMLDALHLLLDPGRSERPFERVFSILSRIFKADAIIALRHDPTSNVFRVIDATEPVEQCVWANGPFFEKVASGKVRSVIDTHVLREWAGVHPRFSRLSVGLFVPLKGHVGNGLLAILRHAGTFSHKDLTLAKKFSLLASHAFASADAMEQRAEGKRLRKLMKDLSESQEKLRQLALFDNLSGLPNRVQLEHLTNLAIANHKASGQSFAFIYIDLNDFKLVNDHHGHDAGDELIVCIAKRLTQALGEDAIVSRVSGDEFAVIVKQVDEAGVYSYLRMLDQLFDQPFGVSFGDLFVKAAFGAAIFPIHGADFATLRRRADNAMYRAKADRRSKFMVFDRSMASASTARMDLAQQVRQAVQNDQIECWMQPQFFLKNERIGGFECLARIKCADGRYAHTGRFIQVASESGLLDQITLQILEKLLARIDVIKMRYPATRVSFNVAPFQACDDDFVKNLISRLASAGCIEIMTIEITEDAVLGTSIFEKRILPLLRAARLEVAIDDFGTGYSSLSLIGGLPIDELKIDRSFIQKLMDNPNQEAVLRAICNLALDLNLRVVAEGVETNEQKQALAQLGVQLVQGYLFGEPAPIDSWLS